MVLKCGAEAKIGDHYHDPGNEARDCGDVDEPVENCSTSIRDIKVRQECEDPSEEHSNIWDSAFVGMTEEFGAWPLSDME
jgi:hypothetical protein